MEVQASGVLALLFGYLHYGWRNILRSIQVRSRNQLKIFLNIRKFNFSDFITYHLVTRQTHYLDFLLGIALGYLMIESGQSVIDDGDHRMKIVNSCKIKNYCQCPAKNLISRKTKFSSGLRRFQPSQQFAPPTKFSRKPN